MASPHIIANCRNNHLKDGAGKACAGQSKVTGRPFVRLEKVGSEANRGAVLLVGSNWSLFKKIDDLSKFLLAHVRPAVSGRGRTSFYLKAGAG